MESNGVLSRRGLVGGVGASAGIALLGVAAGSSASAAGVPVLRAGSRGEQVKVLQRLLAAKGYWNGAADGAFGHLTQQAVLAVQKVNGLSRDGVVGARTWAAVQGGRRPSVRSRADGIEVNKGLQVLIVVRGGRAATILNTSTGNGRPFMFGRSRAVANTPSGNFRVWYAYPGNGWQVGKLGSMWRPYYFNGDIAIHGSAQIPAYPASHGCCRVSVGAQNMLIASRYLARGTSVRVY